MMKKDGTTNGTIDEGTFERNLRGEPTRKLTPINGSWLPRVGHKCFAMCEFYGLRGE